MAERLTLPVLPLREVVLFPGRHRADRRRTSRDAARHRGRARPARSAGLRRLPAAERRERHPRGPLHHRHHRPYRPAPARAVRHAAAAPRRAARHRHPLHRQGGLPPGHRARGRGDGAAQPRGPGLRRPAPRGADPRRRAGPEVRPARRGRSAGPRRGERARASSPTWSPATSTSRRRSGRCCSRR